MSRQLKDEEVRLKVPFIISLIAGVLIIVGCIVVFMLFLWSFSFIAGALIFVLGLLALGERVITLGGHMREQLWFRHPIWYATEVLGKSLMEWITSGVILIIIGASLMTAGIFLSMTFPLRF